MKFESGLLHSFLDTIDHYVTLNSRKNFLALYGWECSNPARFSDPRSLAPLRRFSPILRYLRILSNTHPNSQIFDLISSLPLLEDLNLGTNGIYDNVPNSDVSLTVVQPSAIPYSKGWGPSRAGWWAYQTVLTSGSPCFVTSQGIHPVDNSFGGWVFGCPRAPHFTPRLRCTCASFPTIDL